MAIDQHVLAQRDVILRIAHRHGGSHVRIFGSRARGQSKADSDLDLLIVLEPGRSLLDLVAIKQDLEDHLRCRVDVVTEAALSPYIRDDVLKDAISL